MLYKASNYLYIAGIQYAYLDPASKAANATDLCSDVIDGTSRSQDDANHIGSNGNSGVSGGLGIINGIRSGLSAASKKSARSEITLDELSDLYRSEAEEELREKDEAERRERLAVATAANKRLFGSESQPESVTINSIAEEQSSTSGSKYSHHKTPQSPQQSTCAITAGSSMNSSSIQMKIGSANDGARLRKPSGNNKKINRLSCKLAINRLITLCQILYHDILNAVIISIIIL